MNINQTLERADFIQKIIYDQAWEQPDKLIEAADKTIRDLVEIIAWYDKNQRMLISTLAKETKENKKMKNAIVKLVLKAGNER